MHKGPNSTIWMFLRYPKIFVSDNIGSDGFQFEEVTRQTDNYNAGQDIYSSYAMIDAKFAKRVSVLTD